MRARPVTRSGVMIVDCHMPDVDGFMLVEEIRRIPKLQGLVTLMLTSGGQRGDGARCKEALLRVLGASSSGIQPTQPITRHTLREGRRNLRILLAEDNSINQRLASRLLEREGHFVVVVSDGVKALEAIERESFDLILMDVQMPIMDGLEATAAIRERESTTGAHTPIVAMTAHAMAGDRQRFLAHGMDGYVAKHPLPRAVRRD